MAVNGTVVSLLGGVSQQVASQRPAGQLTEQINMLSDPVNGLRRRPPAQFVKTLEFLVSDKDKLYVNYIGSEKGYMILIDISDGNTTIYDQELNHIYSVQHTYLRANSKHSIQTAVLGDKVYLLNKEQELAPSTTSLNVDPYKTGFLYVKAGAFSKTYNVKVYYEGDTTPNIGTYTTPNGTNDGDAGKATPDYIAQQLVAELNKDATVPAKYDVTINGSCINIKSKTDKKIVNVLSDSGDAYVSYSSNGVVRVVSDLPPIMDIDRFTCAVGTDKKALVYFYYSKADNVWYECEKYGSITSIGNAPISIDIVKLSVSDTAIEGRTAGDDYTNDDPHFVKAKKITGISVFQGRLVFLSGAYVAFSSSTNPERFYRSTVTQELPTDRIEVASGSVTGVTYNSAIQFNRDLLLFGDSIQAVITSGSGILTPQNATITINSSIDCKSEVTPITTGQTVLYCIRRKNAIANVDSTFAGILEMIPSQYTASQYTSNDISIHIPTYIKGEPSSVAVASNDNIVAMMVEGENSDTLLIYQYLFADDKRAQSAFSSWRIQRDGLSGALFNSNTLFLFYTGGSSQVEVLSINIKEGFKLLNSNAAYLDDQRDCTIDENGVITITNSYPTLSNYDLTKLKVTPTDLLSGQLIPVTVTTTPSIKYTVPKGVPAGNYKIGFTYESKVTLSPIILRDANNNPIWEPNTRLVKYIASLKNSGDFLAQVVDDSTDVNFVFDTRGLLMNSPDLRAGKAQYYKLRDINIPCRTSADLTNVSFYTEDGYELNIINLQYILKLNQRSKRI